MKRPIRAMCSILAMSGVAACSNSDTVSPGGTGAVELRMADSPSDDFESATVFVSSVYLKGGGASASEVLVSSTKTSFNLLTLQNGTTALLASANVAAGTYSQVRLVVDSARVVLKQGHTFADGSTTAKLNVPSGSESGIKIDFSGGLAIGSSKATAVIDFDVSRSFLFQGPRDRPNSCSFRPVAHAIDLGLAASISGTVMPAGSGAAVYAIAGVDTAQTTFADASGGYTLRFLAPGTYVAAAAAVGFQVALSAPMTVIGAQSMTGVNLVLVAIP